MVAQLERGKWLINVTDYHRMIDAGIFTEDDRLELIEGEIIPMSPVGWRHINAVNKLNMYFAARLAGRVIVSVQNPVQLGNLSEPEPDVVLLRPEALRKQSLPTPADVLLLVEVSDSTLDYDRQTKARIYARAGITELWILNLTENALEVYGALKDDEYRVVRIVRRDETLAPAALPDFTVNSNDLLDEPTPEE